MAIPFFSGDAYLAKSLFCWIKQLDGNLSHGALLISDPGVDWGIASECLQIASSVFQRVEIITTDESWQSWPAGANALFKTTAQFFQERKIGPWLWLEPDAIPLNKGWLDTIQAAYFAAGKPFMGPLMEATEPHLPKHYLPGVSVYPADCWKRMLPVWQEEKAFDVATAWATVPFAAHTDLIHHFWGVQRGPGDNGIPPIFVSERTADSPKNAFTLDKIKPEAVIFHRNKDGSLLKLLGYKDSSLTEINLDVVLPFYSGDAPSMLKNLKWMNVLHGKKEATAVLLVDSSALATANQMFQAASAVFKQVIVRNYSSHAHGWPVGPNQAFQAACLFMAGRQGKPGWFWMEPDAVPVTVDWLEQLSAEYIRAGKPFMGTIIGEMDHLNGVAVYPADVQMYCKSLMKIKAAWDTALSSEIFPHRHRANFLIQHHRSPPSFASEPDLRAVDPGVVVFHPEKSGRLIDWMAKKIFK